MNKALSCALAVALCLCLAPLDGMAAQKKKAKVTPRHQPTRAELYEACKRLIHKQVGADMPVFRMRILSTGKVVCYYAY